MGAALLACPAVQIAFSGNNTAGQASSGTLGRPTAIFKHVLTHTQRCYCNSRSCFSSLSDSLTLLSDIKNLWLYLFNSRMFELEVSPRRMRSATSLTAPASFNTLLVLRCMRSNAIRYFRLADFGGFIFNMGFHALSISSIATTISHASFRTPAVALESKVTIRIKTNITRAYIEPRSTVVI